MADIFISYSKKHADLTASLARDLEAAGYTTWWDTSLLPGDEFPDEIKRQLDASKAVIVIWTESSVMSKWVRAEAALADARKKLITVRDARVDIDEIPLPFNTRHTELVTERTKIFAVLARQGIVPAQRKPEPVPEPRPRAFSRWLGGQAETARGGGLKPGESFRDLDAGPEMVVVPAGKFLMGSSDSAIAALTKAHGDYFKDEAPQHEVTIPRPFAVGRYAVTFDEWDAAVAAGSVSYKPADQGWGRGRRPVINVSWDDAQAYIKWLSSKTGQTYRLLSEAEWEYCCRAGTTTHFWWGDEISTEQANYNGNYTFGKGSKGEYRQKTVPVDSFQPNPWGLYQVHGNVWEWCADCWNDNYHNAPTDGSAWATGDCGRRVLRGGSWFNYPQHLRAAYRYRYLAGYRDGNCGFRVART